MNAIDAEIAALTAAPSLPYLASRLIRMTEGHREPLLDALAADPAARRRVDLTLRVQNLLPENTPQEVARDVAFLLATVPSPDPEHEQMLLQYLAEPDDPLWKQVYADFLEDRSDPRAAALRAEVAAVEAGMSPNTVCGVLDAGRHFGVAYTPEHLTALSTIPFSPETFEKYKDTHVLVAGAPLSVNDVRRLAAGGFGDAVNWYDDEPFANDKKTSARWYLLRKGPLPESRYKTYDQQIALLTKEEVVPLACELIYAVILHWLAHHERLLADVYVRCRDLDSDGDRVSVGHFDSDGFHVDSDWDAYRHDYLGLASSVPPRKS